MKNRVPLILGLTILIFAIQTIINQELTGAFFFDCCEPRPYTPTDSVPRFAQNSTVNVYVDAASPEGFTSAERQAIKQGLEDWNGRDNNSNLTYNVDLDSPLHHQEHPTQLLCISNPGHRCAALLVLLRIETQPQPKSKCGGL